MTAPTAATHSPPTDRLTRVAGWTFLLWIAAGYWTIAPMSITAGLACASAIACWIALPPPRWVRSPVDAGAIAWAIALVLATVFAVDRAGSFPRTAKAAFPFMVGLAAWHARDPRLARRALAVLLVSVALSAAFGIALYLGRGQHFPARARGAVGHYITYGGQLMIGASAAVAVALRARSAPWRVLGAVAAVLAAVALALTYTRSSWLGLAAGLALVLALVRPAGLIALVLGIGAAALLGPASFRTRLLSSFDLGSSWNEQREYMWQAGWRMFRDHPITGVGLQDLHALYQRYRSPGAWEPAGHLHSVPVQVAATMGVAGLVAWLALYGSIALTVGRGLRDRVRRGGLSGALALGAAAAFLGFAVAGLFEWNLGDEELLHPLFALVGLAWAAGRWSEAEARP
jgi:O-antigen ligase